MVGKNNNLCCVSGKQTFRYKVMSLQVVWTRPQALFWIRPQTLKLLKNFDHFKYNLCVNEKNIWGHYSSFFKPSTRNYLHLDWTLTCIETYMTSCELHAQQSPKIIILPCTFHLEKTCSVGWSVWRVLKSSSWAKASPPAQLTNHDMIFSQKQSENIQKWGNSKKPAIINLVASLFLLLAFTHDLDAFADQLYRLFIFFQTISNDVYGFHRIYLLWTVFCQCRWNNEP